MEIAAGVCGVLLILVVLWEGFETVVNPRRATRRFRLTRLFYRMTWRSWGRLITALVPNRRQETFRSFFGPLSLLLLLSVWAACLILGYGLLYWSTGAVIVAHGKPDGLFTDLYMSGTTFFTLGLGDAAPANAASRLLAVIESGMGFGFLALVIAYLPALNQSFARREVNISLLDARAGSPPTASEMIRRHGHERGMEELRQLLHEWERWSAELLESHLSYPVLAYFRSQHDNQSWLAALTAVLDTSALVMASVEGASERQAELTFAMARHALVDLSLVFRTGHRQARHDRLPPEKFAELREALAGTGIALDDGESYTRLTGLRRNYEPYVHALASYFRLAVPPWLAEKHWTDNWRAGILDQHAFKAVAPDQKGQHF